MVVRAFIINFNFHRRIQQLILDKEYFVTIVLNHCVTVILNKILYTFFFNSVNSTIVNFNI